jgi:hypothetical protein
LERAEGSRGKTGPLKSQAGPINSAMAKLLWGIQASYKEIESEGALWGWQPV